MMNGIAREYRMVYWRPHYQNAPTGYYQSGLQLEMMDGSIWFHPYDGSQPRQVA